MVPHSHLGDTGGDTREEEILNKVQLASHDYLNSTFVIFLINLVLLMQS